jgi:sugar diacid utilization regulator
VRIAGEPAPKEKTILCFVSEEHYRMLPDTGNRSWVVLCHDAASFSPAGEGENAIVYTDAAAFEKGFLLAVSLLAQEQNLSRGLGTIMAMIMNDDGTQQVVDAVAELFDSPAALVDRESNVIAYSESRPLPKSTMREELEQGHLNTQSYSEMVGASGGRKDLPEPVRFAVRGTRGGVICYVTNVYIGSTFVGSLLLFTDERGLSQMEVEYLSRITNILAIEMKKNGVYTRSMTNYISYVLANLLDDPKSSEQADVRERLAAHGVKLKRYLHVLLIDASGDRRSSTELNLIAHRIQDVIAGTVYLVRISKVICLMSSNSPSLEKDTLEKLESLARDAQVKIGVSGTFEDAAETSERVTQAQHALKTGERLLPTTLVCQFEELGLYDLVYRVSSDLPISSYEYRPLLVLREYDRVNNTQLLKTLVCYLLMPRDTSLVCERLGIHRNTLYYRLKKIQEVMGVDVDAGPVVTKIFLTLVMLRCSGSLRDWPFDSEGM